MTSVWLPEVVGDPAGMRTLAGVLRSQAAEVGSLEADLTSEVKGMVFEGPAGDRFRERMQGIAVRGRRAAEELQDLAGVLERGAAEVEAAQRAREQKLEEMRREQQEQAAAGRR